MTLGELRALLRSRLHDEVALRILVEEVTGERHAAIALGDQTELSAAQLEQALAFAEAIEHGMPLQHVIGHWSFRALELRVDDRALIPRPETELLVDVALDELRRRRAAGRLAPPRCLDLGTGTGAIALSLVREWPEAIVVACDVDRSALELASENCELLDEEERGRLTLCEGSWFEALDGLDADERRFDVICSNPPYLSAREWAEVDAIVREHDPKRALVGGERGTEQIEQICIAAPAHLLDDGLVVIEIGWLQGPAAIEVARGAGARSASVLPDLASRDRILLARF